jgi:hypothetical protein
LQRFRGSGAASWQLDQAEADALLLVWRGEPARALALAEGLSERALSQRFRSAERISLRLRMLLGEALGDEAGAREAAAGLRRVIAPELHESSGNVFVLPQSELLQLWMLAARKGWDDLLQDPDSLLVGRWSEFPVLQAQAAMVRGWQALRAGRPDDALRLVLKARDQAPLFASFELEAAAHAALGQQAERRERVRQAKARLGQGLAENYNHFSTHLPNLLAWQRMSSQDAPRPSSS